MAPERPLDELEEAVDAAIVRQVAEENPDRLFRFED
jgi:hypothetical protein